MLCYRATPCDTIHSVVQMLRCNHLPLLAPHTHMSYVDRQAAHLVIWYRIDETAAPQMRSDD